MAALVNQLLEAMVKSGGSDLHLMVGVPAKARVNGDLLSITDNIIDSEHMQDILKEICSPDRWDYFLKNKDLNFAYEIENLARFRVNYFNNYYGMAAVFREIPSTVFTIEQLNLPEVLKKICEYKSGLVCITGSTGSGKSTTLAAMIDYINDNYSKHIISLEQPIEFVHRSKNSIIFHREIGTHTCSYIAAIKSAIKSNPDILIINDMTDKEIIRHALKCAGMGILVFATLRTNNALKTIDRIIESFSIEEQPLIKTMLAESLKSIVSQLLCRKIDGGRIAVHEILLWTDNLPNTIRHGQVNTIRTVIDSNRNLGMCSMDGNLKNLLSNNIISGKEAYMKASDKKLFLKYIGDEI